MGNFLRFLFSFENYKKTEEKLILPDSTNLKLVTEDTDVHFLPNCTTLDNNLDKIFTHLDLHTLKTCRLVSHHFRIVASREIQRQNRIFLEFNQDKGNPNFFFSKRLANRKPLSLLNSLLEEESGSLFCTQFEFHGNLGVSDTRKFFSLHGPQIKSLTIDNLLNYFTKWTVLHKLLKEAPNIEILTIYGNNFDFDLTSNHSSHTLLDIPFLPKLKHFKLNHETTASTLYKILAGAPNLLTITNFHVSHLEILLNCLEHPLLPLSLHFVSPVDDGIQNKCTIFGGKIVTLTLTSINPKQCHPDDLWCNSKFSAVFYKVINLVKDDLQQLRILPLGWLQSNDARSVFPPLVNLKHLQITRFPNQSLQILPSCVLADLSSKFPHLVKVTLDTGDYSRGFWYDSFTDDGATTTTIAATMGITFGMVKELTVLKIGQRVNEMNFCLTQMRIMFPNVVSLSLSCERQNFEFIETILRIWDGIPLERIEFYGIVVENPFEVDAVLTGLDRRDCARLYGNMNLDCVAPIKEVKGLLKKMRNWKPCILDFKELKNLKIGFKTKKREIEFPVSIVSQRYAFNLMPNLAVVVEHS